MPSSLSKTYQNLKNLNYTKIFTLFTHSIMLVLCLIGSFMFLQRTLRPETQVNLTNLYSFSYTLEGIKIQLLIWLQFIKIKILIPVFIFAYFYYCIKNNIFHRLIKQQYVKKYDSTYGKIHKLQIPSTYKAQAEQKLVKEVEKQPQNSLENESSQTQMNRSFNSSLNMSMQMVRSMSKSMLGSLKSIGSGGTINNSLLYKPQSSLMNRSSRIVQNISRSISDGERGKDLSNLFDKNKSQSESVLLTGSNVSSSGISGDEYRVRIKNKNYYEMITQSENDYFQKWQQDAVKKFIQTVKREKFQKQIQQQTIFLKRGLQKELSNLLMDYKQNTESIKQCLIRYYCLKFEGYSSKRPYKSSHPLTDIFQRQKNHKLLLNNSPQIHTSSPKDITIQEKQLFSLVASPIEFINYLSKLKIPLRRQIEKQYVRKQLQMLFQKRRQLNILLNINTIGQGLYSEKIKGKLKLVEKAIKTVGSKNKGSNLLGEVMGSNQILSEMDILESEELENIRFMVQVRVFILTFVVNKINLLTSQTNFKVKMKQAVTYDSGYLTSAIQFFKNSNFAEVVCSKGRDNIIPHFNLQVFGKSLQNASQIKQTFYNLQPGIDNSFSVILFLAKKISELLNQRSFSQRPTYEQSRKEQTLQKFIDSIFPSFKI